MPLDEGRIRDMAARMRRRIIDMARECGGNAHLGAGLSIVEIMAVLYSAVMNFDPACPKNPERDRFILSKGHGVLGYYTALALTGVFPVETLKTFQQNGTDLVAHPVMNPRMGIESSNGSLGQGLSFAVGIALSAKLHKKEFRTYALLGNGECNEGSVWEAVMAASQFELDNLTAVVDCNDMQSDGESVEIMNLSPIEDKFAAFGWKTVAVDGHNIRELYGALASRDFDGRPTAVMAHTVKGKGISFMERGKDWHHNRLTQSLYEQAVAELEAI
ncbi:MAG: transketolase [Synergistaceae bacterium]|jgi:transketolase|nr:transketolase [Synergistaceae bacterium]